MQGKQNNVGSMGIGGTIGTGVLVSLAEILDLTPPTTESDRTRTVLYRTVLNL